MWHADILRHKTRIREIDNREHRENFINIIDNFFQIFIYFTLKVIC